MALTVRREPDPGYLQPAQPLAPDYGAGSTPFGRMHIAAIQGATDATERQAQYMGNQVNYDRGVARQVVAQKFAKSEIQVRDRWAQWQTHFRREALKLQGDKLGVEFRRMGANYRWNLEQVRLGRKDLKLERIAMIGNTAFAMADITIGHLQERKREREEHKRKREEEQKEILRRTVPDVGRRIEVARAESRAQMAEDIRLGMGEAEATAAHENRVQEASREILREASAGLPGSATTETVGKLKDYVNDINAELSAKDAVQAARLSERESAARYNAQLKQQILAGEFAGGADYAQRTAGVVPAGMVSGPQQAANIIHAQRYEEVERPLNEARAMMKTGKHAAARTILEEMVAANETKYGTDSAAHLEAQKRAGAMAGDYAMKRTAQELEIRQPGPLELGKLMEGASERVRLAETPLAKQEAIGVWTATKQYAEDFEMGLKMDHLELRRGLEREVNQGGPGTLQRVNAEITDLIEGRRDEVQVGGVTISSEEPGYMERAVQLHSLPELRRFAAPSGPTDREQVKQLTRLRLETALHEDKLPGVWRVIREQDALGIRSDVDDQTWNDIKGATNTFLDRNGLTRKQVEEAGRGQAASNAAKTFTKDGSPGSKSLSREEVRLGSIYDMNEYNAENPKPGSFAQLTQDLLRKYPNGADWAHHVNAKDGIRDMYMSAGVLAGDAFKALQDIEDIDKIGFDALMEADPELKARYESQKLHDPAWASQLLADKESGRFDQDQIRAMAQRGAERALSYEEIERKNRDNPALKTEWEFTKLDTTEATKRLAGGESNWEPGMHPVTELDYFYKALHDKESDATKTHRIFNVANMEDYLPVYQHEKDKVLRTIENPNPALVWQLAHEAALKEFSMFTTNKGWLRTLASLSDVTYHDEVRLARNYKPAAVGDWGRRELNEALLVGPYGSVEAMPTFPLHRNAEAQARYLQGLDHDQRERALDGPLYGTDWKQLDTLFKQGFELTAEPVVWHKVTDREDGQDYAVLGFRLQGRSYEQGAFPLPAAARPGAGYVPPLHSVGVTMDGFRIPLERPLTTDGDLLAGGVRERYQVGEEMRIEAARRVARTPPGQRR